MKRFAKGMALLMVLCLLMTGAAFAEDEKNGRISFLLLCNEGMRNDGDNVQSTIMAVSFDPELGTTKLLMFTWDTFIQMEGYDIPQIIDQPYRVTGPEGTLKAFNENFDQDIDRFLSINYLNLANLIDDYGGVEVNITRAERNALNGMVASKKENIEEMAEIGMISQMVAEQLVKDYYLQSWGDDTHLNGLQSVAFGWLQYDSVYNCCMREGQVISDLFGSVGDVINSQAVFYTNDTEAPNYGDSRRVINLDAPTEEDLEFLYEMVRPIFDKSYHNLEKDEILSISLTLGKAAYLAARQGTDVFKSVECDILPLEVHEPYAVIAGREGHVVDYEANAAAIKAFLYGD